MDTLCYTLGLLLFFHTSLTNPSALKRVLATIVVINGMTCHGSSAVHHSIEHHAWCLDVVCNLLMIMYVNMATSSQPGLLLLTIVATMVFASNRCEKSWMRHVLGVQFPLWLGLILY